MPSPAEPQRLAGALSAHAATIAAVRRTAPLVHCILPAVTMPLVADALTAVGARPMMTETAAEAPLLTARADALLVNLGALTSDGTAGAPLAAQIAASHGIPWVLDPAALGPTPVRRTLAALLLRLDPDVVRGNADEIAVLDELVADPRTALAAGATAGPDSRRSPDEVADAARRLADRMGAAVSCSGAVDLVVAAPAGSRADRDRGVGAEWRFEGGHRALTRLVGTGCALSAITAACAAVADPATAARTALAWSSLAAEVAGAELRAASAAPARPAAGGDAGATRDSASATASAHAPGPGAFRAAWLEALDRLGRLAAEATTAEHRA